MAVPAQRHRLLHRYIQNERAATALCRSTMAQHRAQGAFGYPRIFRLQIRRAEQRRFHVRYAQPAQSLLRSRAAPLHRHGRPIQEYLDQQPLVQEMVDDIDHFMNHWLPRLQKESRSYVTIAIGCTGGQHRSVYVVEKLAQRLQGHYELLVRHRQAHNLSRTLIPLFRRPFRYKRRKP